MEDKLELYYKKSYIIKFLWYDIFMIIALLYFLINYKSDSLQIKFLLMKFEFNILFLRILIFLFLLVCICILVDLIKKTLLKKPFLIISKDGIINYISDKKQICYEWENIKTIEFRKQISVEDSVYITVKSKKSSMFNREIPNSSYDLIEFKKTFTEKFYNIILQNEIELIYK